jgi:UDP-3-O-[3-hydroxymyristoyl] N-acetylglucosamine deacetylase
LRRPLVLKKRLQSKSCHSRPLIFHCDQPWLGVDLALTSRRQGQEPQRGQKTSWDPDRKSSVTFASFKSKLKFMFLQKTIKSRVQISGVGLHSGMICNLDFVPAPPNTGIHFVRKDLPNRPSVKVHVNNVSATGYATTLGGPFFSVSTVEHCLSALAALRIDNLLIELDGPEIPINDGSSDHFLKGLQSVGLIEQNTPRKYCFLNQPIYYSEGDKQAYVTPYNGLRLTVTIEFPHPAIGRQKFDMDINEESFAREISRARTFGFLKDVEALQKQGLAKGGSLDNAVVMDDHKVLNPSGLRWADEFVRHKALDALGDLVTLGMPLMGHVVLYKAGHDIMNKLVKKMIESTESYRQVELGTP